MEEKKKRVPAIISSIQNQIDGLKFIKNDLKIQIDSVNAQIDVLEKALKNTIDIQKNCNFTDL